MSPLAPRAWHPVVWLTLCFAVAGIVGGLVSRRYSPDAGVGLVTFWVVAWGAVGVAGGLALRASRRR
jgi:hypothetical protein